MKKIKKIYESTEYIEKPAVGDLKLEVISRWDFKSNAICFEKIRDSFSGDMTIAYKLKKCTWINPVDSGHTKWEEVEKITKDIKKEILKKKYVLAVNLLSEAKK